MVGALILLYPAIATATGPEGHMTKNERTQANDAYLRHIGSTPAGTPLHLPPPLFHALGLEGDAAEYCGVRVVADRNLPLDAPAIPHLSARVDELKSRVADLEARLAATGMQW